MKKFTLLFTFFVLGIIYLSAQTTIFVGGHVTNSQGGAAIANHAVYYSDSLNNVNGTVFTDTNGYYSFNATINGLGTNSIIIVTTYDCQNYPHFGVVYATNPQNTVNFSICDGTPPSTCNAGFYYYLDSTLMSTPNLISFYNTSTTTYSNSTVSYLWNFGDGTSSTLQHPTHQFQYNPVNTTYNVCLIMTVMDNNTNTVVCGDTFCLSVMLLNPNNCFNNFTYSNQGLIYSFTGNVNNNYPTIYNWNFGDGTSATGQNITHTFAQPPLGSNGYNVCLNTFTTYPNGDSCFFQSCQAIYMGTQPNQFIHGNVLAGNNHIDYGYVVLYGLDLNSMTVTIDTTLIDSSSTYSFGLNPANFQLYLLKAFLLPTSIYYNTYLPTYYDSTTTWINATPVTLNTNTAGYTIHLVSLPVNPIGGNGSIGGNVTQGIKSTNGTSVVGAQVMLFDMENHSLKVQYSDNNGNYNFTGLPNDSYKVNIEIPGKTTVTAMLTLSSENQSIGNVNFVVTGNTIALAIEDPISIFNHISEVYPNPSQGEAYIDFSLKKASKFDVNIYNQLGQLVSSSSASYPSGNKKLKIDVENLPKGLYAIKIILDDTTKVDRKLVILK